MSGYVEASYALAVLKQARSMPPKIARKHISDFLRDSAQFASSNNERKEALSDLCSLRDLLSNGHAPDDARWDVALKAVARWRKLG